MDHFNSRFFNAISITGDGSKVKKTSQKNDILRSEILWYVQLPHSLRTYIPKLHNYSLSPKDMFIEMERVHSPTLSQLYVQEADISWANVAKSLSHLLFDFKKHHRLLSKSQIYTMYWKKTLDRLTEYLAQPRNFERFYKVNGKAYPNPLLLLIEHRNYLLDILDTTNGTIIHGDLCFSNIFFEEKSTSIKVIDPRGHFGRLTTFGDPRYDVAKLRHSLTGYDFLIHDRFDVKNSSTSIDYLIQKHKNQGQINRELSDVLPLEDPAVRLIESLLFLSMLPLHQDFPRRQWVMYGLGTQLLYKFLNDYH
ncbi:hypothetical protein QUF84_00085 [Fictibacillus enclensis]|uniref:hypothetical protein n=1 Tax=Fictibacillus enclensis TaxID=1017270 RepID=UPI0025A23EB0|nr:hypothetical protein [Fictibacillus enclensis]MDM5335694.1 hypothetical protein [Fictibacillus enclensis]